MVPNVVFVALTVTFVLTVEPPVTSTNCAPAIAVVQSEIALVPPGVITKPLNLNGELSLSENPSSVTSNFKTVTAEPELLAIELTPPGVKPEVKAILLVEPMPVVVFAVDG